jgi:hypothetical protein
MEAIGVGCFYDSYQSCHVTVFEPFSWFLEDKRGSRRFSAKDRPCSAGFHGLLQSGNAPRYFIISLSTVQSFLLLSHEHPIINHSALDELPLTLFSVELGTVAPNPGSCGCRRVPTTGLSGCMVETFVIRGHSHLAPPSPRGVSISRCNIIGYDIHILLASRSTPAAPSTP